MRKDRTHMGLGLGMGMVLLAAAWTGLGASPAAAAAEASAAEDVERDRQGGGETGSAAEEQPLVTIQAQLLNEELEPLLAPVVTLHVGQRCELMIMNSHTDPRGSRTLSLSLHVLSVEGPFYRVRIDADDTRHDDPWTFQTVTYVRAEEAVRFKWSGGDNGAYHVLELVLFDPLIIEEREGEQVQGTDERDGETV